MTLHFKTLFECPELANTIVNWWSSVWANRMGPNLADFERQLLASMSKDDLPILLIAFEADTPVGTAALKLHELEDLYPHCQYWLGSVFVVEQFRGKGLAAQLSREIVRLAKLRGFPHLYLQTSAIEGGLYAKLGWEPLQRFVTKNEETLLMLQRF
jgi:GNAT superfamily N-acetyltransferase